MYFFYLYEQLFSCSYFPCCDHAEDVAEPRVAALSVVHVALRAVVDEVASWGAVAGPAGELLRDVEHLPLPGPLHQVHGLLTLGAEHLRPVPVDPVEVTHHCVVIQRPSSKHAHTRPRHSGLCDVKKLLLIWISDQRIGGQMDICARVKLVHIRVCDLADRELWNSDIVWHWHGADLSLRGWEHGAGHKVTSEAGGEVGIKPGHALPSEQGEAEAGGGCLLPQLCVEGALPVAVQQPGGAGHEAGGWVTPGHDGPVLWLSRHEAGLRTAVVIEAGLDLLAPHGECDPPPQLAPGPLPLQAPPAPG